MIGADFLVKSDGSVILAEFNGRPSAAYPGYAAAHQMIGTTQPTDTHYYMGPTKLADGLPETGRTHELVTRLEKETELYDPSTKRGTVLLDATAGYVATFAGSRNELRDRMRSNGIPLTSNA